MSVSRVITKRSSMSWRRATASLRRPVRKRPSRFFPDPSSPSQLCFPYRYECRLGSPFTHPGTGVAYPAGYLLLSTDIRSSAVGFHEEQREIAALRRSAALFLGESASSCVIASVFYPREVRH